MIYKFDSLKYSTKEVIGLIMANDNILLKSLLTSKTRKYNGLEGISMRLCTCSLCEVCQKHDIFV